MICFMYLTQLTFPHIWNSFVLDKLLFWKCFLFFLFCFYFIYFLLLYFTYLMCFTHIVIFDSPRYALKCTWLLLSLYKEGNWGFEWLASTWYTSLSLTSFTTLSFWIMTNLCGMKKNGTTQYQISLYRSLEC